MESNHLPVFATNYPLVSNILDVVPPSSTHEVPVPAGVTSAPNALCLVCHLGPIHPNFPHHPVQFTIPGTKLSDAQAFVQAMCATICWNLNQATHHPPPDTDASNSTRCPTNQFKLEYTCPSRGFPTLTPNTCKKEYTSACCGCNACFSIFLH